MISQKIGGLKGGSFLGIFEKKVYFILIKILSPCDIVRVSVCMNKYPKSWR